MHPPSSPHLGGNEALHSLSNVAPPSMTRCVSENGFCTFPAKMLSEFEVTSHATSTSEAVMDSSSRSVSAVSIASTAIPNPSSMPRSSPDTAGAECLSQLLSLDLSGISTPPLYELSAEDASLRAKIAVNAKLLLHSLTGYEADDIVDVLYVKETWFSIEVLIYALCLINRLTCRYPNWSAPHNRTNPDEVSAENSPMRHSSSMPTLSSKVSHVCSSTSSDASHADNSDESKGNPTPPEFSDPINSASAHNIGDVFNRHNTRRRVVAVLLISAKFHGDLVYKTCSLTNALNKYRSEKITLQEHCTAAPLGGAAASSTTATSMPNRPFPRIAPAHLGQCEKRLFQELGCTAMVRQSEYQHCEEIVFQGI
ncbi:hypothetical protein JKF63_02587 [Porcisia hertigi]|uniref:Uncharacterized protein n=1 Tax=Porcisia hertigi TaxID=2761500 RepID=A0A836IF83_9TRYP|nr:hypothetical protein JKF63_02587 [Porcisia hertigi]